MATWNIKDPEGNVVKTFDSRARFTFDGYRFGPRDWTLGFQCEPVESKGFTLEKLPDPPPAELPHEVVVEQAANALLALHCPESKAQRITVRILRVLGVAVVTGQPIPAAKLDLANLGSRALEWRADVYAEMERAIRDGDAPVFPAWNSQWDVVVTNA